MKSVAIVVSAYDEEECLGELCVRLLDIFDQADHYSFRCILVDNGSSDRTWDLIQEAAHQDSRFFGLQLSRNFGMDGGLTAGLEYVDEDACVIMAADLQDPPELILEFLRIWELGYENVYAIVQARGGTGRLRRWNSSLFYKVLHALSDTPVPRNVSDFRLLDRVAYTALRSLTERGRLLRALTAWIGFASCGIEIERPMRFAGESKASTRHVLNLAVRGIFASSTKPLRMITLSGLAASLLSLVAILVLLGFWLVSGVPFAGFGTLVSLMLFLFGALALMLGVVAEYVGLIYDEVKGRPNFIVKRST